MGHPEPFNMKMLGIGNEQWDQPYFDRLPKFLAAIKAKYPDIQIISSAGPSPDDQHFKFAWPKLRELHADIVDEHCYAKPEWFLNNTHRYDNYDRNGPKVFMGEYAAQSVAILSTKNRNNVECAIAEAAYLTGLERNADVVRLASYAPLFASSEAWQWTPNLIWVNTLDVYATPNYYVQQLYSRNRGDVVLPTKLDQPENQANKFFASATLDNAAGEIILKVVNATTSPNETEIKLDTASTMAATGHAIVLTGANADVNSFENPAKVAPVESTIQGVSKSFTHTFPANSMTVLRLKVK
jgi:alpha-N-arabinofuranosidase